MKFFGYLFIFILFIFGIGTVLIITGNISMASVNYFWAYWKPLEVAIIAVIAVFSTIGLILMLISGTHGISRGRGK